MKTCNTRSQQKRRTGRYICRQKDGVQVSHGFLFMSKWLPDWYQEGFCFLSNIFSINFQASPSPILWAPNSYHRHYRCVCYDKVGGGNIPQKINLKNINSRWEWLPWILLLFQVSPECQSVTLEGTEQGPERRTDSINRFQRIKQAAPPEEFWALKATKGTLKDIVGNPG